MTEESSTITPSDKAAMAAGAGMAVQGFAGIFASKAEIDNIFANVHRTESNIEQLRLSLFDSLEVQAKRVSRLHGTQMAQVGRSGVTNEGSPMLVMMENQAQGMKDYDAIKKRGEFAIDDAYQSIYDSLDRAKDLATGMTYQGLQAGLGMGAIAAGAG